jgi:drug/metabolite transporter (DMT)-like permease
MVDKATQRHSLAALAAAALFGISAPLSKQLLGGMDPVLLAGLLYCGSGLGLAAFRILRKAAHTDHAPALRRADVPWLAAAVASGGIAAPVLLLWGLNRVPASQASLLLNLEAVFTVLLAGAFFHEHVSGRVRVSVAVMLVAGTLLVWTPGESLAPSPAVLAIVGACLAWGLDNNFTRNIALADPVSVAMVKGLAAGAVNLALAAALGASMPPLVPVLAALVLGASSYGASLVLYIVAQRHLGSARTGAHFATAPFIGVAFALLALGESVAPTFWAALALMVLATGILVTERHLHRHRHERLAHEHAHLHDEHHRHAHEPGQEDGQEGGRNSGPHSHWHVHDPVVHTHLHLPDLHHRHRH